MRVLADEQFNELTEHIKQLEAENRYLKKLLDDAGISYDKTDAVPKKNEQQITGMLIIILRCLPTCITNVFAHTKGSDMSYRRMRSESRMKDISMTVRPIVMLSKMMLLMLKQK